MCAERQRVSVKPSYLILLLLLALVGPASVSADITYTLIDPGSWPADIRSQIEFSIAEAVGLYNQHGSFNKQLYIRYSTWPGVTAEANFNGDLTFGSLRGTRVALHEMAHTLGCGTIGEWGGLMVNGRWAGAHATNMVRLFDGGGAWLYGDKWHFWPYGLNYDNEDGTLNRIRHIRIVASLIGDMGFLSFISEPISQTVQAGATGVFSVNAVNPHGYAWYKQGNPNPLTNGGNISGAASPMLQIVNVQAADEGLYYCVASRSGTAPQASRRARLVVGRLVSHLKFAGNTYDSVGPNYGTVTGAPVYTTGKIGQAIDLNGTSDYVTLPAGAADTDDMTVAAWVHWDGGNHWQRIFDFGNNTSQYATLTPRSGNNTLRFILRNGGGEQMVETAQLATGQWVHVAVTLSGETAIIYVNGAAAAQAGGITINPGDFSPRINYVGKSQFAADALFNGCIDEFRIYSYALNSTDIGTLYAGLPISPSPTATAAGVRTQSQLTWAGGAGGETAWQVYLGTSQAAILTATPASAEYLGVRTQEQLATPMLSANRAYYWRIDPILPDGSVLKGRIWSFTTGNATAWLGPKFSAFIIPKPDAAENAVYDQSLAEDAVTAGASSFQKIAGPGWLAIASDGRITGTPDEGSAGQTFCTVRITDASGRADEAAVSIRVQDTCSGTKGVDDLTRFAEDWLYAGPAFSPADLDQNQAVDMADWSLFAADWNYPADPGLAAAWTMDDAFGETIREKTGRYPAAAKNMNTLWRPVETIVGRTSPCLTFDGIDDYAEAENYKGITGSASRTCIAWVKTTHISGEILTWGDAVPGGKWIIRVNETGSLRAEVQGGYLYGTTPVNDGKWHHIAVVLENDGAPNIANARLYVDGRREPIAEAVERAVNTAAAQDVRIGAFNVGPRYFRGMIDEVRIYDYAFSDAEIAALTQYGLTAYWPFDDGRGSIAAEAVFGFDGVLVNMDDSNWTAGRHMNALCFNGTDEYVAVPGYKGISGIASRTCTAWVKSAGAAGNDQVIVSWGSSVAGGRWMFRLQAAGEPAVAVGGGYAAGALPVTDNQWHHVAAVLDSDGTPSVDEILFYVDGVLQTTLPVNAHPINTGNTESVYIGKLNSTTFPSYFNGLLDDVNIYNRALSGIEIGAMATEQ